MRKHQNKRLQARNDLTYKGKGKSKKIANELKRMLRAQRKLQLAEESQEKEAAINNMLQGDCSRTISASECFNEEIVTLPKPGDRDAIKTFMRENYGSPTA